MKTVILFTLMIVKLYYSSLHPEKMSDLFRVSILQISKYSRITWEGPSFRDSVTVWVGSTFKLRNSLEIYSKRKGNDNISHISKLKALKDQTTPLIPLLVILLDYAWGMQFQPPWLHWFHRYRYGQRQQRDIQKPPSGRDD